MTGTDSRTYFSRINLLSIVLSGFFLCTAPGASANLPTADAALFQSGPGVKRLADLGIEHVVFVTRLPYEDPHWYANIGYFCDDENKKMYAGEGKPDESRLYLLDTKSNKVHVLFDAKGGGVRDPEVHYDGKTVLFSYRPPDADNYSLYEIQTDGTALRRVTHGQYDDFEATYLPDDDIVFVSTRSQRWVGCWKTQVGTLFRCNRQGGDIRPISFNCEHDNTPAVLPDGRIVYTRWEYVDRSQVGYHQLWAMSPNGANVTAYFGNQTHYPLYIDAKPIPGTEKLLLIDSGGHGRRDHLGRVCTLTSKYGPDDPRGYHCVTPKAGNFSDPAPIDETHFVVAAHKSWSRKPPQMFLGVGDKQLIPILTYNGKANIHEPIPVRPRPREKLIADHTDYDQPTGRMVLTDVNTGRSMEGVEPRTIKKLLVLEILPKPVNFSGGMDLTSWLGTFILERVLGTVPVEEDGSAYFEVPAGRPVLFVALDENDMSVKHMQSFTNVVPGETLSCVGCHEHRTQTPDLSIAAGLKAMSRPPSKIKPFTGLPDVIDFCRDIQPILNEHCVDCHSHKKPDGHVVLTDGLGPTWSISYYTLLATRQVADGRNGYGGQKPRTIGSSASKLMQKIDGSHYDVTLPPDQWRTIWLWLESGAPYAGSYAALRNEEDQAAQWLRFRDLYAVLGSLSCRKCHGPGKPAPAIPSHLPEDKRKQIVKARGLAPHERIVQDEDYRFSAHVLLNVTDPEHSRLLLGPLPKEAGGWGTCQHKFTGTDDKAYQGLLYGLKKAKESATQKPLYGMSTFRPNRQFIREMKRFGVLAADFNPSRDPIDFFDIEQEYWQLFWYQPDAKDRWPFLR